ncbi:MAG: diaminopimelate epimerase [Gammaproteobacteria bacterium]|nr:diaminopimelate epimerase [Gammaproteobacteria bacterium]
MNIPFVKMHALGNDFVIMRGNAAPEFDAEFIRSISNRHTGIGFDQLMWLEPPRDSNNDIFYRIYNADGGEVEQCGNGARCIASLIAGPEPDQDQTYMLEFGAGIIEAEVATNGEVRLNMGVPSLEPADLPFVTDQKSAPYQLLVAETPLELHVVSMGNPHAVLIVNDIRKAEVATLGPMLEHHECFPSRANIGFMQVLDSSQIKLRVFERGVGETLACGTGACAAVVAGQTAGLLGSDVTVSLTGGDVKISWEGVGRPLYLTGEAITVFEGHLTDSF